MSVIDYDFRAKIAPVLTSFGVSAIAIDRVCQSYSEQWRSYHATRHILGMLRGASRLSLTGADYDLLCLLIIYHDVWLKISREPGENERKSAAWAIDDVSTRLSHQAWLATLLQQGIEATITHTLDGVDDQFREVVSYLLDLDLWGLGQSPERFQEDTEAVWHEFEPRYTRAEFDAGRSSWAATFLTRERVYHTKHFAHLEGQARANLTALANSKPSPA